MVSLRITDSYGYTDEERKCISVFICISIVNKNPDVKRKMRLFII
jgi:hypothetical protein